MAGKTQQYCRMLTIAGSDSGGGAGIQADLKTFSVFGCYGMSVITAITAQNSLGVQGVEPVSPESVGQQLSAVLDDIGCDGIKIGMLHSARTVRVVADLLRQYEIKNVVLDPVMVSTSGAPLLEPYGVELLKNDLIPLTSLITPNLPEASVLLGRTIHRDESSLEISSELAALGSTNVLLTGGHGEGSESIDLFYESESGIHCLLSSPRITSRNLHGTGCTLSAAVSAARAKGMSWTQAVQVAKNYMAGAIEAGVGIRTGSGNGPLHHFWQWWSPVREVERKI